MVACTRSVSVVLVTATLVVHSTIWPQQFSLERIREYPGPAARLEHPIESHNGNEAQLLKPTAASRLDQCNSNASRSTSTQLVARLVRDVKPSIMDHRSILNIGTDPRTNVISSITVVLDRLRNSAFSERLHHLAEAAAERAWPHHHVLSRRLHSRELGFRGPLYLEDTAW